MNFLSKIALIILLFTLLMKSQAANAQQVGIQIDSFDQVEYVSTKWGDYHPRASEDIYELELKVTNSANERSELLLDRLLMEGNGYTSEVDFIYTGKKSPVRPDPTLMLPADKARTIKVYYTFPKRFTPAHLIYDGNLVLNVQDGISNVILLNADDKPTANEDEAVYRREIIRKDAGWMLKDYYFKSNALQMEMPCSSIYPMIKEGKSVWYYENGNVEYEREYVDNEETGMSFSYYEDGSPRSVKRITEGKSKYHHYYDEGGNDLLSQGKGEFSIINSRGYESWSVVEDSVLIASYQITENPLDTVFVITDEMAEPAGGLRSFYMCIQKTLKYPAGARRRGVQGKVFVQFIVSENGELVDIQTVKGIGYGCDEESEKAIKECEPWEPAKFKGRNVKVRMILPITFKLG